MTGRAPVSGLARLLPIPPAGQSWIPVRTGESGDLVYRRSDGAAYAKIAAGANVDLLDGERRRIEWLATFGLGSPTVLDWIATGDGACLLMSAVPGVPASDLAPADLIRAWPSIAQMLASLHELSLETCPFERTLLTMIDLASDVVARGAVNPAFLPPEDAQTPSTTLLARLREELPIRLAQEPRDLVVCHGDPCLPNFLVDPETLRCTGMIDLGRLGVADRYADLSLLLTNARETWSRPEEVSAAETILFDILAIPAPDRDRLAFYLRLDPLTWG